MKVTFFYDLIIVARGESCRGIVGLQSGRGILQNAECRMTLSLVIGVRKLSELGSTKGHYTGKMT